MGYSAEERREVFVRRAGRVMGIAYLRESGRGAHLMVAAAIPDRPVGSLEAIHGLSAATIKQRGEEEGWRL